MKKKTKWSLLVSTILFIIAIILFYQYFATVVTETYADFSNYPYIGERTITIEETPEYLIGGIIFVLCGFIVLVNCIESLEEKYEKMLKENEDYYQKM
jgi:hypothetical protein